MPSGLTAARRLALEITREVRLRDAYVRELIDTKRKTTHLDKSEFDFAQVLSFGVIMCQGILDEFINRNLKKSSDIKAKVRDALRISAYEILYLHKPDHVVVNQGVELVRLVVPRAAGLGNYVLRHMIEDAKDFPWCKFEENDLRLSRETGMPLWLTRKLTKQYGFDVTKAMLHACLKPAPTYKIDNPYKADSEFVSDLSAQKVADYVPLGGTVLEVGAGRGTKTMLIQRRAYYENKPTLIHTVDVHSFKEKLLKQRLQNESVPNVITHTADACDLSCIKDLPESFDCVFLDVPCSGTGTLRRHPEIRWHLTHEDIASLCKLQLALLKEGSKRVKSGAVLLYATCSILEEENQDIIEGFLASPQGKFFKKESDFASLPSDGGADGHFAACLVREP